MGRPLAASLTERNALLLFEQLTDPNIGAAERDGLLARTTVEVRSIVLELEAAACRADGRLSTSYPTANPAMGAKPARIGPYRLVELIGEGGMGEVWRAERDDGLFDQKVAIKLLSRNIFSELALAQFADERRIFARLRHPHVAQMFDGGVSPEGVPYIVMELIAGEPIDCWADRERLPLRGRIALFREAADAVGYAHRNLIVHADIKPSNVAVEAGFGVKLLDFGIARLLDEAASPRQRAFTHAYASPARMEGSPPTTADDMFAMGRLLRELVAKDRACDADLLAVADRAAAPDPDRRYGTMAELKSDLDRWLRHKPVSARAHTRTHAVRLFWRRNRLAASIGATALVAMLITIGVVSTLWVRAEHARLRAEQRFAQTRAMANYMLDEVDPQLGRLPGSLPLRRRLVARAQAYLADLERDRDADPDVQMDVASGYLRLARIYGLDVSGGLGDLPAAYRSLARARALIGSAALRQPSSPRLLWLRGEYDLISATEIFVAPSNVSLTRAFVNLQAAQAVFARYLRASPDDILARLDLWQSQIMVGRIYAYRQQGSLSQRLIEPTLGNATMPVVTPTQRARRDFLLNGAYLMLADSYEASNPGRAERYYDLLVQSVARMQARGASDFANDRIQATALAGRGSMEARLGRNIDARKDFRMAIDRMDRLLAAGPNQDIVNYRVVVQLYLAHADARFGDIGSARALLAAALAESRRVAASGNAAASRMIGLAMLEQGDVDRRAGSVVLACADYRAAAEQWKTIVDAHGAMGIDYGKGGPIETMRNALIRCGLSIVPSQSASR